VIRLAHSKVELALHELRGGGGQPLLLLHGLGERSPKEIPLELSGWPGPLYALDFTGHGDSTLPFGGGYTAEVLMGDTDAALAQLGEATIVGRGLGGYVGLLTAGGRPERVRGLIIRDGPGLAGGGGSSPTPRVAYVDTTHAGPPDPFALDELSRDIRPRDYAASFARQAMQLSGLARPITVCALARPDWLAAILEELDVEESTLDEALADYADASRQSPER
jgi:pimeloyl-ACP methyl ester carboxylesterase